jgi:uncharacterized LabA/DUF88 family protein
LVGLPIPSDPHLRRWMVFVDGENLALRAKAFAANEALNLAQGANYEPDVFVWLPDTRPLTFLSGTETAGLQRRALRAPYYTSVAADQPGIEEIRRALWDLGFHPEVFKKDKKEEKAKGVDIALTKDMLSHAYLGNYDVAVLVAGDGDYVPLVEEVKRRGKVVYVVFFARQGLNPALQLACDTFYGLDDLFRAKWSGASDSGLVAQGAEAEPP